MSTNSLMMITTMVTPLICMASNSWIMVWMTLEMNTLAFCGILSMPHKKSNKMMECSIKYFIIQSIASSIFIIMSMQLNNLYNKEIIQNIIVTTLMLKMAGAPFQEWFVKMSKNMKKYQLTILMTWQKVAPIFLMMYQTKFLLILFILLSMGLGSTLQLNKTNMMEIMSYSSVFNLGWMLMAIMIDMKLFILLSIIYWASVIMMMYLLKNFKMNVLNMEGKTGMKKWILLMIIANLAGMPPLSSFLTKWLLLTTMMKMSLIFITTLTLTMSAMNFFIYLRSMTKQILNNTNKMQMEGKTMNKTMKTLIFLMNIIPIMMVIMLGYAWNKGL